MELRKEVLVELMEAMIGSKSSDYNKGVQDCINLVKNNIPKKIDVLYVTSATRDPRKRQKSYSTLSINNHNN